jgi:hypothetical protein
MSNRGVERFLNDEGRLDQWPTKFTDKMSVLGYLAGKFDAEKVYAESEVNEILKQWHTFSDWPLLRRSLYDYGFMDREPDGSRYRIIEKKLQPNNL